MVTGSNVSGTELEFVENQALYGGCVYASESGFGRFSETQFLNNTAENGGAAINSEYGFQLFISNSTFKGNAILDTFFICMILTYLRIALFRE